MRRLIALLAFVLGIAVLASAQTATKTSAPKKEYKANVSVDNNGNFVAVKTTATSTGIKTDKTYTDAKGVVYPVYRSKNGKHYVIKTSKKTGNEYKMYLKLPNE